MPALVLAALVAMARPLPATPVAAPPPPVAEIQTVGGPPPQPELEEAAVEQLVAWLEDPVAYVRANFGAEPDEWQADALRAIARDPRVGLGACKGPGKSTVLAWGIWWFVDLHEDAQAICTSITGDNLRDGLWKELAVWYAKSDRLQRAFDVRGERILHRDRPKTWWVSSRTWPQGADPAQQANSLAGFHSPYAMVVLDEMGDYPDGVVVAAEAIFANEHIGVAKLVAAWNPTRTDGPAYRICTKDRKRWTLIFITGDPDDPKRSPRISKAWAQQMIDDWGRDNDWVRVNVLGQFPRTASDKLLGPDQVNAAIARGARHEDFSDQAKLFGLDVAAYGDDRSVVTMRQGVMAWEPETWRQLGPSELTDRVAALATKHQPDAIFVDVSGGYGLAVFEGLRALGFRCIAVDFGGAPVEPRFLNKRAEMYWNAAEWVKKFGCLPADQELAAELMAPSYTFGRAGKKTALKLEEKAEIKKRLGFSPDKADSLVLTFAQPVEPRSRSGFHGMTAEQMRAAEDFQPSIG